MRTPIQIGGPAEIGEATAEAVTGLEDERVGLEDLRAAAAHASACPEEFEDREGAVFYSDEEFIAHLKALPS